MAERKNQLKPGFKLLEEGRELFNNNKILESIEKFEAALSFFRKMGAKEQVESIILIIRKCKEPFMFVDEQYQKALKLLNSEISEEIEKAIPIFENTRNTYSFLKGENSLEVANTEFQIGSCFQKLEKFTDAISHYDQAIANFNKKERKIADCKTNIGYCLFRLGNIAAAKKYYEEAIELYQKFPISIEFGDAKVGLGRVLIQNKEYEEAKKVFDNAEQIFVEFEQWEKIADIKINIGRIFIYRLEYKEAIDSFKKAKDFYKKSSNQIRADLGLARANLNIGETYFHAGDDLLSISFLDKAEEVFQNYGYISEISHVCAYRGLAWKKLRDFESSLMEFEKCSKFREFIRLGIKSPELRRSINKEFAEISDEIIAVNLALADLYNDKSKMENAFNTLELAKCDTITEAIRSVGNLVSVSSTKLMKRLLAEEDKLLNFAAQKFSKYMEIIRLGELDKISSNEVRNSTKNWENEYNKIYEEIQDLRYEVIVKFADIGDKPLPRDYNILEEARKVFPRDRNWAVLEFGILNTFDKPVVFLIQKDGFIFADFASSSVMHVQRLVEKCRDFFQRIREEGDAKVKQILKSLSAELYLALIPQKIHTMLNNQKIDDLIIIPHKFLHWVPFEILFDGDQYWGLKYSISNTFSLDLVRLCIQKSKNKVESKEPPRFLLIKNPLLDLKLADLEIEEILKIEGVNCSRPPLEHEEATQKNVIDSLRKESFEVLHYAGHAVFVGKDPSKSSLWLHTNGECPACNKQSKMHSHDLLSAQEITHEIKFKQSPLVYLSACESGGTEIEEGDEMFGLVRALIYSGATSLILSHWVVRGEIAPILAKEFYSQLIKGEPIAQALQKARIIIQKKPEFDTYDWGLFFLNGDPFRQFPTQNKL